MSGIEVDHVSRSFGTHKVLDDVSMAAPAGQVTGLVGPNGCGKTTLLKAALGLTAAEWTATFAGKPLRDHPCPGRVVGAVLDPAAHAPHRTVRQMLRAVATYTGCDDRVESTISEFGLATVAGRRFGRLSLGMKQRAALACAFLPQPPIMIFDEPMNGLDVDAAAWLTGRLRAHADAGGTVVISSHLLRELQEVADSVVILSHGKVTYAGPPQREVGRCRVRPLPEHRQALLDGLAEAGLSYEDGPGQVVVLAPPEAVSRVCLAAHVVVTELTTVREDLVDLYQHQSTGEFAMGGTPS